MVFWNDDYQTSILPVFADIARSWSEGQLPLLSPYSWVCSNLAGEFQYGTFSVFINAAIVLIWKLPLKFAGQAAVMSITHLVVLAAGGFVLARDRKLSAPLSMIVALVTALNGWIICWGATDWFGALGAFAWLPWSWWGLARALDRQRTRWRFLWPAPFVYLLVTGGFPYTVLMLGLVVVFLTIRILVEQRSLVAVIPMLVGLLLGLGMAAPSWLALADYIHGSAREAQDGASHWQWRVPFAAWPGLVWPAWTVNWTDFSTRLRPHAANELACGFLPLPALLAGLVSSRRILLQRIKWELALLIVIFILAMLPSASVFRWSFRWLPLFHLLLAICAAESLQSTGWRMTKTRSALAFPAIVYIAFLLTYLATPPNCGVPRYHLEESLRDPGPLDPARLYLSVYPPAELAYREEKHPGPLGESIRPGSTSMWAGLRFVNGYSPIRPAGVARSYGFYIHGEIDLNYAWYLAEEQDAEGAELDLLGVDGIIVAHEIGLAPVSAGWDKVDATDEAVIYHRHGLPLPTVRSLTHEEFGSPDRFVRARIGEIEDRRNRVTASVSVPTGNAPALIAFSRPYFRGYRARLNGAPVMVGSYNGMMPTIELPAGAQGKLELTYSPWWFTRGGMVALTCLACWLVCTLLASRRA